MEYNNKKITIIGSGIIGRCWTTLFLRAGYKVAIYDINASQINIALKDVKAQLHQLSSQGLLREQNPNIIYQRLTSYLHLAPALEQSIYVQECVPERLDLKIKVFAEIDKYASEKIIIASSSSCIKPSKFTNKLQHKSQCLVVHPVNPPQYIPLVELVPAPWTNPSIIKQTHSIMKELGQSPITLYKEIDGFVLNRLQYALLMEAWRLVEDGVCSPTDIDLAVSKGLGCRWSFMGPFQTIDLNANGVLDYCQKYGENITAICQKQKNSRQMKNSKTAILIEKSMRQTTVPLESLGERIAWRDRKLAKFTKFIQFTL